jgi:hypothetical protein
VKALLRIMGLALIAAFIAVQAWACLVGLTAGVGIVWALGIAAALLWLRLFRLLQLGVFVGAVAIWHLPILIALVLAVPRAFLMLPGLLSTYLASRRHPRPRWSQ